jgi:hypothetical protein
MINRILYIVVFFLIYSFSFAADTHKKFDFSSGEWKGAAYVDTNGLFTHCIISAKYQNGIELVLSLTRNFTLILGLNNEKWSLPEKETYYVTISIDGKILGSFNAIAIGSTFITINLGDRNDIFENLRSGNILTITTAKGNFYFNLTGTSKALQQVKEYAEAMSFRSSNDKNPFAKSERNPFSSTNKKNDSDRKEIVQLILSASGLKELKFIDPKRSEIRNAEYAWESGNIFGVMSFVPSKKSDEDILKKFVGNFAQECEGTFGSKYENRLQLKSFIINQAYAACKSGSENIFFAATVVDSNSESLIFLNFSQDDPQSLKDINDKLGTILRSLLEE